MATDYLSRLRNMRVLTTQKNPRVLTTQKNPPLISSYATPISTAVNSPISTINYPTMNTIGDAYGQISGLLPDKNGLNVSYNNVAGLDTSQVPTINYNSVSGIDPNQFQQLTGFDDSYYQSLQDEAEQELRKQYFEQDNSLENQLINKMSKRGLSGSGIELGNITDLYSDFGDQLASVIADNSRLKSENDLALAEQNRSFLYDLLRGNKDIEQANATNLLTADTTNAGNLLDALFRNQETSLANAQNKLAADTTNVGNQLDWSQLGLSAASDQMNSINDYNTDMFGHQVDLAGQQADVLQNNYQNALDLLSNKDVLAMLNETGKADDLVSQIFTEIRSNPNAAENLGLYGGGVKRF